MSNAASTEAKGARTIQPALLLRWLASGRRILVLDVREEVEAEQSRHRWPGARCIPLHQLFVRRNELPLGKVDTVVTVSNKGVRSQAAAFTLALLGFTDVRSLEGGLDALARRSVV